MEEWKYNWWRNSYWKKEEAKLELSSNTEYEEDEALLDAEYNELLRLKEKYLN